MDLPLYPGRPNDGATCNIVLFEDVDRKAVCLIVPRNELDGVRALIGPPIILEEGRLLSPRAA